MSDTLRINLELQRMDNPALYDELAAFPKGTRRVNRLRTLAHEGLLYQRQSTPPNQQAASRDAGGDAGTSAVEQLFGAPRS